MANTSVKSDLFAKQIIASFRDYTDEVEDATRDVVKQIGDEGVDELHSMLMPEATESGSAKPMNRREWKKYSASWYNKEANGTNYSSSTIANKKHYQLTHLLEFGHATRDGQRTRAFAHIVPLSERLSKKLEQEVKNIIKKGGK